MPELFNNDTNKQGLIVYGGESSSDYGMVVAEAPAYERPKRKQTIYNVPGRNGSIIFQQDAWEDVNRSYKVWLAEDGNDTLVEKVDDFEAMLNSKIGYQRLEDNFEPDVFRLAYYSGGDGFTNNMTQYGEATLNFTCRPERFLKSGETVTRVESGDVIVNPTNYTSKPFIHIHSDSTSHSVSFGINGLVIGFSVGGNSGDVYIDCESMAVYNNQGQFKASTGKIPVMTPGDNTISLSGTVAGDYAEITPRFFII